MKEESRMTLENFNENLKKYARLIA